jgi:transcriptional regulator with XRE-family HTH domain
MSIQPGFGKRVREARDKAKLTQRDAAKRAKITSVYLCQLEHGEGMPSMALAERLAKILGTTVAGLLG